MWPGRPGFVSDLRIFWLVLVRDPYLFLGLLLLGVPTVVYWHMYRKLSEVGFRYESRLTLPAFWWEAHVKEYARTRAQYGWPAWPLHAMWLDLAVGVPLLVTGVSKL
jgi:hypothetical protein